MLVLEKGERAGRQREETEKGDREGRTTSRWMSEDEGRERVFFSAAVYDIRGL